MSDLTSKNPKTGKRCIKGHNHDGYYNDGNSHYWCNDYYLDLDENKLYYFREDTYGGQLAKNGSHEKREEWRIDDVDTPGKEVQEEIYECLKPVLETVNKYPNIRKFKYFSKRHRYLIQGRIRKAVKLFSTSPFHLVNCLTHVFVLPEKNIIITAYPGESTWNAKLFNLDSDGKVITNSVFN